MQLRRSMLQRRWYWCGSDMLCDEDDGSRSSMENSDSDDVLGLMEKHSLSHSSFSHVSFPSVVSRRESRLSSGTWLQHELLQPNALPRVRIGGVAPRNPTIRARRSPPRLVWWPRIGCLSASPLPIARQGVQTHSRDVCPNPSIMSCLVPRLENNVDVTLPSLKSSRFGANAICESHTQAMKRRVTVPITAFFQRKQPRTETSAGAPRGTDTPSRSETTDAHTEEPKEADELDDIDDDDDDRASPSPATSKLLRRDARHVTHLLNARELGAAGGARLHPPLPPARQKQQLVRWVLSRFQPTALELRLPEHWQRQAGTLLSDAAFYASCIEFDTHGVLLATGSSNGIIALFDFDEHFYRSINLAQIHMIFTRQEIKRIRWNPSNEDEIACSFSDRNEIHIFNLQKFPTKPHRVLKATSPPSSGYNDIVFFQHPATSSSVQGSDPTPRTSIIGGDLNGSVRMWDPKFPHRPSWSISTGTHPVSALMLSPNKQLLVCGTELGYLVVCSAPKARACNASLNRSLADHCALGMAHQTYDILNLSVPAFGSRAIPQRKASFHVLKLIKPYLTSEYAASLLLSTQAGGIMSIRSPPSSSTHVICQLRNDWIVVLDFLAGVVLKLHTRGSLPMSIATASEQVQSAPHALLRADRSSWLSCHRCSGALLFDGAILCTGIYESPNLNVIDLNQVPRGPLGHEAHQAVTTTTASQRPPSSAFQSASSHPTLRMVKRGAESVGRLDRFRVPMDGVVTAVSGHPTQKLVVCGGEGMRLQVVTTQDTTQD
ncbi:hypothetical protein PybrP1_003192 [[Pythium] brassicae (nom. inval.)]|nr:hypothetical protein PybrP1_003192 [[Pythium] brassicae (nom. inval.)]